MKRRLSIFLALACLFSSLTFTSIAQAENIAFTDVTADTQNYEAIYSLAKLGIINGYPNDNNTEYSFKPNGDITRAEFAKIITVAMGIANENATGAHDFTDIDSHWGKPYIITAAGRKIVNGFEDATFRPDENVTYEQAVKMIVCAAGYEEIALTRGGWPNGYMAQAADLSITKDAVTDNQSGKVSRGVVAQLMYNVLDVKVLQLGLGVGGSEDGKTFLEEYLGITKVSAKIVGIEDKVTNEYPGTLHLEEMAIKLRDGSFVVIDCSTYDQDKSVIENYVGQEAVVYYKKGMSGDPDTLFELDFNVAQNTVVTIKSDNIDKYSSGSLRYADENSKRKTASIDASASVYYNGKIVSNPASYLASWLDPGSPNFIYGEVKITDSGNDGKVDVLEITDYEFMVVSKTPSSSDYTVFNKVKFNSGTEPAGYISDIPLDPESLTYSVSIKNTAGKSIDTTALRANDVLLVAESLDSKVYNVLVNSTPVTGKITSMTSEGVMVINKKEYKLSDYAKLYFTQNNITIETGVQGTFYVDAYGTVVYGTLAAVTQATSPYAYIIRAIKNDDEGTGTLTAYVPSANAVKTYNLSGKVKYNGSSIPVSEAIDELWDNIPSGGTPANYAVPDAGVCYNGQAVNTTNACQVARITLEGNTVKEINVAETSTYGNVVEGMITPYSAPVKTRYSGSNNFNGNFYVNSSTTFIFVPQDRTETKLYAKKTLSSFTVGSIEYWVQPYNVNSSKVADLVMVYGKGTETVAVKNNTQVSLMAENHSISVKNEEEVYDVKYFSNSDAVKSGFASIAENCDPTASEDYTEVDIGTISFGDFFRAGVDTAEGMVNAELVLDYDYVKDRINNYDSDFTTFEWKSFGGNYGRMIVANVIEVVTIEEGKYSIRVTREGFDANGELNFTTEELIPIASDTVIYRLDTANEKVTPFREGTEDERIDVTDLHESKYEGNKASRIGIYSYGTSIGNGRIRPTKMILIYK